MALSMLNQAGSRAVQPMSEDVEEGRIKMWEGPVMSTYSRELADWQGAGYGPLVSMTSVRALPTLPPAHSILP